MSKGDAARERLNGDAVRAQTQRSRPPATMALIRMHPSALRHTQRRQRQQAAQARAEEVPGIQRRGAFVPEGQCQSLHRARNEKRYGE